MIPPIYVYEPLDLDVFASVELAERYLEPIDVVREGLEYFDSEGRILEASVDVDAKGYEHTLIQSTDKFDRERLRSILIDFLEYLGHDRTELEESSLEHLSRESLKFKTD